MRVHGPRVDIYLSVPVCLSTSATYVWMCLRTSAVVCGSSFCVFFLCRRDRGGKQGQRSTDSPGWRRSWERWWNCKSVVGRVYSSEERKGSQNFLLVFLSLPPLFCVIEEAREVTPEAFLSTFHGAGVSTPQGGQKECARMSVCLSISCDLSSLSISGCRVCLSVLIFFSQAVCLRVCVRRS